MGFFLAACVFAAFWSFRYNYNRTGATSDLKWVLGSFVWIYRRRFWDSLLYCSGSVAVQGLSYGTFILTLVFGLLFALAIYRYYKGQGQESQDLDRRQSGLLETHHPLKPLVFPCRTTHARFFPKKHSFSYSYLFVGIPIGWRGSTGSILSADLNSVPLKCQPSKKGWLSVESADYLSRGDHVNGLQGKLDLFLRSENEDPKNYAYSYLITAPRILGYSFNPVSFWYLYNEQRQLKAMILEVNNTFDERRMYFLEDSGAETIEPDQLGNSNSSAKFANTWTKDFHVSPFNSRKGSYSFAGRDPFHKHLDGKGTVDNTITLSSSKKHVKLVARIFSTSESLDPSSFTTWDALRFFASWWWVGFVTFPRIVREAGKLFFKRRLHVWFRPEVSKDSIGRNATPEEEAIALCFRDFLEWQVEQSDVSLPVDYIPALPTAHGEEVFTSKTAFPDPAIPPKTLLIFKPTTPLFYANLVRTPELCNSLTSSLRNPDINSHTLYTTHPDLLAPIFLHSRNKEPAPLSLIDRLYFVLISALRNDPHTLPRPQFDEFAISLRASKGPMVRSYQIATLKILISDRIAFGLVPVVDGLITGFRIWLCWLCAQAMSRLMWLDLLSDQTGAIDVGKLAVCSMAIHVWWLLGQLL